MSVEFYRESPGKFDSRTLSRKTLNRWTGRMKGPTAGYTAGVKSETAAAGPRCLPPAGLRAGLLLATTRGKERACRQPQDCAQGRLQIFVSLLHPPARAANRLRISLPFSSCPQAATLGPRTRLALPVAPLSYPFHFNLPHGQLGNPSPACLLAPIKVYSSCLVPPCY